ncbi:beta-lactamase family protein [Permianibacter sp. IMCC34836]|nr:beta-lactamase family protein [Permianibacter fluminis]
MELPSARQPFVLPPVAPSAFSPSSLGQAPLAQTSLTQTVLAPLPFEAFDHAFRQQLDAAAIPGGAYAIVRDGKIIQAAGHGTRTLGYNEPISPTTVFRLASVSKTFAAELTALLVREGKLKWDDPVNRFVPDFQFKTPRYSQALQVQHLLGQSTGLIANAFDNLLNANQPLNRILPRFRELDPICQPGQCYSYQNIMFGLIAPVVEQAAHASYSNLIQQRLFQPLQMQQASVGMQAFLRANNRALPHIKRRGNWVATEVQPGYYEVLPAAGINASVTDLGKWLIAQMGNNPEVVPTQVIDQLTEKRVRTLRDMRRKKWRELITDAHYGLGWRIYQLEKKEELFMHSGWVEGYVTEIAYSKVRRTGLVVLLNAESAVINDITTGFWAALLNEPPAMRTVVSE